MRHRDQTAEKSEISMSVDQMSVYDAGQWTMRRINKRGIQNVVCVYVCWSRCHRNLFLLLFECCTIAPSTNLFDRAREMYVHVLERVIYGCRTHICSRNKLKTRASRWVKYVWAAFYSNSDANGFGEDPLSERFLRWFRSWSYLLSFPWNFESTYSLMQLKSEALHDPDR